MRRPRRNRSPAFKAKVALAAITSDGPIAQVAARFDVHAQQILQWKRQLLTQAAVVFSSDGVRGADTPSVDVKALHAKIGEQALALDFLADALGQSRGPSGRR